MNLKENKYSQYALVQEMMDTVETVKNFNPECTKEIAAQVSKAGKGQKVMADKRSMVGDGALKTKCNVLKQNPLKLLIPGISLIFKSPI